MAYDKILKTDLSNKNEWSDHDLLDIIVAMIKNKNKYDEFETHMFAKCVAELRKRHWTWREILKHV